MTRDANGARPMQDMPRFVQQQERPDWQYTSGPPPIPQESYRVPHIDALAEIKKALGLREDAGLSIVLGEINLLQKEVAKKRDSVSLLIDTLRQIAN